MPHTTPENLVRNGIKIPSLPTIFYRINEMVEDPECSFSEVAKLISGDPSLSARLLRLANSAYMGSRTRVETISHAITLIGMAQLRDLVLGTMVTAQFKNVPKKLISMESFWKHSIACGVAARIVAIYRREPNAERFYVLGMLHDLGRLIIFINMPDEAAKLLEENSKQKNLLHATEMEMLGYDHANVGGELLSYWNLPESLQLPIRNHHKPGDSDEFEIETAIVHFADTLAHALKMGSSGETYVTPIDPKAWSKLELSASMVAPIVNQMELQFPLALQLFMPK